MHRGGVHTEMEKYREETNVSSRKQRVVVQAVLCCGARQLVSPGVLSATKDPTQRQTRVPTTLAADLGVKLLHALPPSLGQRGWRCP